MSALEFLNLWRLLPPNQQESLARRLVELVNQQTAELNKFIVDIISSWEGVRKIK